MRHIHFGKEDRRVMLRASERRAGEKFRGLTIKHVWHFKSVKHPPNVWETLIFVNGAASCNCKGWTEYRTCWHTSGRPLPKWTSGIDFDRSVIRGRVTREAKRKVKVVTPKPVSKYVKPQPSPEKPKWVVSEVQKQQLKDLGFEARQIAKLSENGVTQIIARGARPREISILPSGDVRIFKK